MRGRKRKPIGVRELQGNPGKRAIPKDVVRLEVEIPPCPKYLDDEEKKKWQEVSGVLLRMRVMTTADTDLVALYCQAWVGYLKWNDIAKKSPMHIYKDGDGKVTHSQRTAAMTLRDNYCSQARSIQSELGLSPTSRARLKTETHTESDEFEEYLKLGKQIAAC